MGRGPMDPTPPAELLLPHGPPARFVERIVERSAAALVCRARIPAASPWAAGGNAPATAGLEIAAQAAAWLEALERAERTPDGTAEGGPRVGYLVRVRRASLGAAIPAGAPVLARVERSAGVPPLAIYRVEVTLEAAEEGDEEAEAGVGAAALVCRGSLGTYLTDETLAAGRPSGHSRRKQNH